MKRKEKKRHKKPKINFWLKLLIVLAAAAGIYLFASSSMFDVTAYEVEGNSYYTDEEILVMGNCKTGGNIFWGTDCGDIKERLEQNAYMEKVKVRRILPDTIRIEVTERVQTAALVYGEHYVVIDGEGIVLRNVEVEPQLTLIKGMTITKIEEGQAVEVEEKVRFRQIMDMLGAMNENDMYFVRVEISEAGVKAYVLENLMCQGTPQDITSSMEAGYLQEAVRELFSRGIERGTLKVSGDEYISFSPEID